MNKQLISAIISAVVVFSACKNDENMGLELLPSSDRPGITVTDTIIVKASTLYEDSVYSTNQSHLLVGSYIDPVFGKSDAAFCAKFSNTSYGTFKSGAVCDSVVLTMQLDTTIQHYYGDLKSTNKINIYPLTTALIDTFGYYSNYDYSSLIAQEPIASAEFVPQTTKREIKFSLPLEFGNKIIKCVTDKTFDANFFGLCFRPDADHSTCIVKASQSSNSIKYQVFSHNSDSKDTIGVTFSIASTNTRASFFEHDFSGKDIVSNTKNDTLLYMQSMSGTKIKIDLSDVKQLNNHPDKYFILLRAQLFIPVDSTINNAVEYTPVNKIVCMGNNKSTGDVVFFPEFVTVDSYYGTQINSIQYESRVSRYTINMTARVSDLLQLYANNQEPSYDIMVYPYERTSDFCRTILNGPNKQQSPMKLVVQYTVYDKTNR